MRKIKFTLFSLAMLVSVQAYAQPLDRITFEDCNNASFFEDISNGTEVLQYIAADGAVLNVGDTLILGVPNGSTASSRAVGGAGGGAHVGGGISASKTNVKSQFATIRMGKPAGFGNVVNAVGGGLKDMTPGEMQGQAVVIAEMSVRHDGSKKKPLHLTILLGEPNGRAFGINKYMSTTNYEASVKQGEIRPINAPLSRDEAIAKLKESKELFDLGIMEEADYNVIKDELTPIIMQGK